MNSVLLAVIVGGAGFAGGYAMGSSRVEGAKAEGYQEGLAAAKTKVDQGGLYAAPHLTSLHGTIKSVSATGFDMEVEQVIQNPLAEPAPLVRHVTLAADATILLTTQKSDAAVFKDLEAYEKAVKDARAKGQSEPQPPLSYDAKKITLDDLKAGDTVTVDSKEDIALAASIVATAVRVESAAAATAAPTTPTSSTPPATPGTTQAPPSNTSPTTQGPALDAPKPPTP